MKSTFNLSRYFSRISKQQTMTIGTTCLLIVLLTGGFFWLKSQMVWIQTVENLGYKKETLLNPYLAAQTFLDEIGIRTKRAVDIEIILDTVSNDDTVILLNKRKFHPVQAKKIMAWLANGGHLILSPSSLWNTETESSKDEFLDSFGIRFHEWDTENSALNEETSAEITDIIENYSDDVIVQYTDEDNHDENSREGNNLEGKSDRVNSDPDVSDNNTSNINNNGQDSGNNNETNIDETLACASDKNTPSLITYNKADDVISINFRSRYHLEDTSNNALHAEQLKNKDSANHILQYPVGEGMLTVMSDLRFWKNRKISWYNHSYLLWMLVSDSETAWFVFDTNSPNLLSLLWNAASHLIISLGICLALLLWQRGRRFGPITPDDSTNRRQLIEHIEASARFSWNHKQFEPNMTVLLNDIRKRLLFSHNIDLIELESVHTNKTLIEKISHITQIQEKDVRAAFKPNFEYKEHALVQRVKLLQQLRNQL